MTDHADTLVGTTLAGTYILDSVLGEGGMGRVYQARHTRIAAKRFAIKVLHQQYAQHEEALERFKREAEAAALISHPNVVGVHDYGRTQDGRPFLVSDFLVGEELADRLHRESTLPIGEAVRIVRQVCSGLAVAHANGVTHRDVKPENVFLVGSDDELSVKLLDFGISRFVDNRGK
ncbi:MAG: serine/threonine-protein kinase, partial [Polyangiaceae bacterium]